MPCPMHNQKRLQRNQNPRRPPPNQNRQRPLRNLCLRKSQLIYCNFFFARCCFLWTCSDSTLYACISLQLILLVEILIFTALTWIGQLECLCPNKAWASKVPQRSCSNGSARTTCGGSRTRLRSPHVISPKAARSRWGHRPLLPLKPRPRARSISAAKSAITAKTHKSLSSKCPHRRR